MLKLAPGTAAGRDQPTLIDTKGLIAMLGRSRSSIHRDRVLGRMPAPVRIGRSVKWSLAEIRAWIEAGCPACRDWHGRRKVA